MKTRTNPLNMTCSLVTLLSTTFLCFRAAAAQFEDVTVAAGVTNAPGYCISPAWGDYNNDNFVDLYLATGATTASRNALCRTNGNGTFTRVGAEAGPITTNVTAAASSLLSSKKPA